MSADHQRKSPALKVQLQAGQGEQLERAAHPFDSTLDDRPQHRVSVASHQAAQHALKAACICLHLCAGRHPQQIAAEVAARAITALRSKTSNHGNAAMSEITTTTVQRIQAP